MKNETNIKNFKDLKIGSAFLFNGLTHVKTHKYVNGYECAGPNAVRMKDYDLVEISDDDQVIFLSHLPSEER